MVISWNFLKWTIMTFIIHKIHHIPLKNKQVKERTNLQSENWNDITLSYGWRRMHMHSTKNSWTKDRINAKCVTKPFDNNVLTTFLFVKVLESVINNVSKKVIDLMINLYGWTFILVHIMIVIFLLIKFHLLRLINPLLDVLEYILLKIHLHHETKYLFWHLSDRKH